MRRTGRAAVLPTVGVPRDRMLAERVGFEPTGSCDPALFKSAAIDRSATSPSGRIPRWWRDGRPRPGPGSGLDDDRAGDQVVPAAAALVDEDPDEPEVEDSGGHPVADHPDHGAAPGQQPAVRVADDLDAHHPAPRCLSALLPVVR